MNGLLWSMALCWLATVFNLVAGVGALIVIRRARAAQSKAPRP